jgi:PGF-CTERM protein
VTVTSATDIITGSRTISDTTVAPGDTFTVTVTVDITGTVYGPVLNEDVPAGWTVTEVDNADGTYNAADTKWLWGGSQTADKTVIYDVTVPAGTADDSYDIAGTVLATVGGTSVSNSVGGTDQVTVGGGGPVTLTWQTEPPASVMQGSSVTFDIGFSTQAEYYSRIEDSAGTVVYRYPPSGTSSTGEPRPRAWTTSTSTTPGEYTIVININGVNNSDTKTFTVTAAASQNIVAIGDVTLDHGATTEIPIQLLDSTGVGGGTATLTFNPSIVNTTNMVAGDFDGVFNPDYSDVGTGTLRLNCMTSGADLTGDRTIATVTLEAVGTSGSCTLGLSAELTTRGGTAVTSAVKSGTVTIRETAQTALGSVTISPASSDLVTSGKQPFTATCYDTNSNTLSGCTLTWACNSPAVGTIDSSSGLFTACGVGTATVTVHATCDSVTKTDTAVVTVSAQTETVDLTDTDNFTEDVDAGTSADITVNGTFDNSVTGSINITPVANPEATVGSYEFTGNDKALIGLTVTPDAAILAELANGNDTIRIEICYDAAELASKNIEQSTLAIWRFDGTEWVRMVEGTDPCVANGRDGNCVWVEVNNLSTFALAGTSTSSDTRSGGGGGGGSGTYPPGWFGTPTATVTSAQSSSSSSTTPDTTATTARTAKQAATKKPTVKQTTATKASGSGATAATPAKKGLPGFEGVFAIAGLLAIAYVMMRRKR